MLIPSCTRRRLLAGGLAGSVLVLSAAPARAESGPAVHGRRPKDVPAAAVSAQKITWVTDVGLSNGYPDGTYKPDAPLQRDAVAAFLYRLAGSPAYTAPNISPFTDMKRGSALYREVCWMVETRLAQGYPDGSFQPVKAVTREVLAPFFYRYTQRITS